MSQTFIQRAKQTVDGASAFTPSSHNPPLCKMKHARRDSPHHKQEKQKQMLPNLRNIQHPHHCRLRSGNTLTFKLTRWYWLGLRPHVPVTEREHFLCALISGNRTRVDSRKEENHKEIAQTFHLFWLSCLQMAKTPADKAHMVLIRERSTSHPTDGQWIW